MRDVKPRFKLDSSALLTCVGLFVVALSGRFDLAQLPTPFPVRFILVVPLAILVISWRCLLSQRGKLVRIGPVPALVLGLIAAHAASSLWAHPDARLWEAVANDMLVLVLAYAASLAARTAPLATRNVFLMLFVGAAIVYVVASANTGATSGIGRAIAFGGGPNVFGRVMVWGVIGAAALAVHRRRALWLVATPAMIVYAVLSASRGVLVSAVVTALIMAWTQRRSLSTRQLAAVTAVAPFVVWVVWTNEQVRFLAERRFAIEGIVGPELGGRGRLWDASWRLFWDRPIFGHGIDSFYAKTIADTGFPYPHNLILEIGNDLGILGVLALAGIVWVTVRTVVRQRSLMDATHWGMFAVAVFTFSCTMFSGDFFDSRFLWISLCVLFPTSSVAQMSSRYGEKKTHAERTEGLTQS